MIPNQLNSFVRKHLNSTGSTASFTSTSDSSSANSSKLNLHIVGSSSPLGSMTSIHHQQPSLSAANTNDSGIDSKKGSPSPFKRRFLSPFSSTSSVFSTNSSNGGNGSAGPSNNPASAVMEFGAQMRRISVPLSKAKNSFAARRLSHFVQSVGDAVHQEIMVFNGTFKWELIWKNWKQNII